MMISNFEISSSELIPDKLFDPDVWKTLSLDHLQVINHLEDVFWFDDPVFTNRCETCRSFYCALMHTLKIRRTDSQIIWFPPYELEFTMFRKKNLGSTYELEDYHLINDTYVFDEESWHKVRSFSSNIPDINQFSRITTHDLYYLWRQHFEHPELKSYHVDLISFLKLNQLAAHPLDFKKSIAQLESLINIIHSPPEPVYGDFELIDLTVADLQTFYLKTLDQEFFSPYILTPEPNFLFGRHIFRKCI